MSVTIERHVESDGAAEPIRMSLVGGFRLVWRNRELRLRSRKSRALLGYLALAPAGEETRERLVGLLWSEVSEGKARASLRQLVHEIRETLPAGSLHAERLSLGLDTSRFSVDVHEILGALDQGSVHAAMLDMPRPVQALMDGLDDLDPSFSIWLMARRQSLHDQMARRLEALLGSCPDAARRAFARALLNLDPTHEEACRQVMTACVAEGDVSGALRAYDALWRILDTDFDMEPSLPTQELVAEIKSGRLAPQRLPAAAPASAAIPAAVPVQEEPSAAARLLLLVEAFAMHGVPEDRSHLVRGFRHDLIGCLARFREWFVMDGGTMPDSAAASDRVSSRYAIDGTAYQAGQRISLVLTLCDVVTGIVAWSERIDIGLETWFEAQHQIVRRIATSLTGQISAARLATIASRNVSSLDAHDRWLLGQSIIIGFSRAKWDSARAMFEDSLRRDAAYAPAYSSLAQLDNGCHIVLPGTMRDRAREQRSLALARRGVELDPLDSRAQLALGWSLAMARQYERAATHMRLACELNGTDSWTLMAAALFSAFCGHHAEAERLAAESLDLTFAPTPLHWAYQVSIAYLRGDDRATIDACDRAQEVIRTLPAWRAAALANLGDRAGARKEVERFHHLVAEAWCGTGAPDQVAMGRWLLHLYPISTPENWRRLYAGTTAAGIPDGGMTHHGW